jgi:hypothetical protein
VRNTNEKLYMVLLAHQKHVTVDDINISNTIDSKNQADGFLNLEAAEVGHLVRFQVP